MPTKPTATFLFAVDANYTTGPALLVGTPTRVAPPLAQLNEGWKARQAPPAQWMNWEMGILADLANWVYLGSAAADADAHIVETDTDGIVRVVQLRAEPQINLAVSAAVVAIGNPSVGGGSMDGVRAEGAKTGPGIRSTGGARGNFNAPGPGIIAVGGDGNGLGNGAAGITVAPGLNADGAYITTAIGNVSGAGIRILQDNGSAIVVTKSTADASPTVSLSGSPSPGRANLFLSSQSPPSTPVAGDIWLDHGLNNFGRGRLQTYVADGADGGGAVGVRTVWSTTNGHGFRYVTSTADSGTTLTALGTKVTTSIDIGEASPGKPTGVWQVSFLCDIRVSDVPTTRAEVVFEVNGTATISQEFDFVAVGQRKVFSGTIPLLFAPATIYTVRIRFRSMNAGQTVVCSRAYISAVGAYATLD